MAQEHAIIKAWFNRYPYKAKYGDILARAMDRADKIYKKERR